MRLTEALNYYYGDSNYKYTHFLPTLADQNLRKEIRKSIKKNNKLSRINKEEKSIIRVQEDLFG